MEVSKRRQLSKPKPERDQKKTMKSVLRVLKERRLFLSQICAHQDEIESARKSGLKRTIESVQNKPLNSVSRVQKKRRLTEIIQSPPPAQEKPQRKPDVEKMDTFIDGAVKQERLTETRNHQGKEINNENSWKSREDENKERVLCNWRRIKLDRERQKQREAARFALEQVKNTCGFQDNMDSMRDFEKLVGCSSTFYIFSRDRKYFYD